MDRAVPSVITTIVILLAVAGMIAGWRARVRKGSDLTAPDSVPADTGEILAVDSGLYVATTVANAPLERVAARGLGFRSRATVTVTGAGMIVELKGRAPFFVDRASLLGVDRATWVIDKAVEPGGLVVVTWRLGSADLDSYFRLDSGSESLLNAAANLTERLA